jgi:hypothetical protein
MLKSLLIIPSFMIFFTLSGQDRFVDPAGTCTGNAPCYTTIQAAVDAAAANETISVGPGTYNENINIDKALTLISSEGRISTIINGSDPAPTIPYPNGTITIRNNTSNVRIGASGQGFTLNGYDITNPAQEAGAIALNGAGPINNITIEGNEIVANGEHGIIQNYNQISDNVVINDNIFSGKTFVGAEPAGCGFGTQFSELNVPRQLVTLGGGSSVTNTSNYTFTNNEVIGIAGGNSTAAGCENSGQGNNLVTIDVLGLTVSGNLFNGTTSRFTSALRARGSNTLITDNCFFKDNMLSPSSQNFIFVQGNGALSTAGTAAPTVGDVAQMNVFFGGGYYLDGGAGIALEEVTTGLLAANEDCSVLTNGGPCGTSSSLVCATDEEPEPEPLPLFSWKKLFGLSVLILGFAVFFLTKEK